ncbi:unnamed protein product [Nezara viridula]|uniref:Tetraspanin n=1 Tax=Nezara viridula TaxID=85310 RepID=A0A9P0MT08_NEZVI|nr:unnamed protein product [Nezara viridula]
MFSYFLTAKIFLNLNSYTLFSSIVLLVGCFTHILISLNFYVREVDFLHLIQFHLAECIPIIFTITYSMLAILSFILICLKFRLTTLTYLSYYENFLMKITLFAAVTLAIINMLISIFCFIKEGNLTKRTENGLYAAIQDYNNDQKSKEIMDRIQIRYRCCGIISYKDWFRHDWFKKRSDSDDPISALMKLSGNEHIPFSCCSDVLLRPCIHHFLQSDKHLYDYDFVGGTLHTFWTEGCLEIISHNYLNAFHSVNFSNFLVMTLYLIQFVFDRIIQTADSTTFINGHLQSWVFMKPAMNQFLFPGNKYKLGALKRKFIMDTGRYKKHKSVIEKKKRERKCRKSVQFKEVVVSYPNSKERSEDSCQDEENKSK